MNIKDMIVSAIVKKGVLFEARNYEMEFDIPSSQVPGVKDATDQTMMKIRIKCDHVKVTVEKE